VAYVERDTFRLLSDQPPLMLPRPSEAPEPLPSIRNSELLTKLHTEWARIHAPAATSPASLWSRVRRKMSPAALRTIGSTDHALVGDLIRAMDALAARSDELSTRLANQEVVVASFVQIVGQEVTQLRAAVARAASEVGTAPADA
jgi:hypothetical protein